MKKYTAYKDSGVEWIGEIPEHWKCPQIGVLIDFISGFAFKSDEFDWDEGIKLVRGINVKEGVFKWGKLTRFWSKGIEGFEKFLLSEGDVLIAMDGSKVGKNYSIVRKKDLPLLLVQRVARLRCLNGLSPQFLYWNIGTEKFLYYVDITKTDPAVPHISPYDINHFKIALPPPAEQTAIAHYLDQKTALIDTLLHQSEKIIALLQEQRTAIINQAVTKGLTHLPPAQGGTLGVPLKDSGVEWIGEVPEHWDRTYLKRLSKRVVVGIAEAATHAYADEGIPILRATNIKNGEIKGDIMFINKEFAQKNKSKKLWANDLVTVRTGYPGQTAVVPEYLDGCQCFTMLITTMKDDCNPHFYSYFINSGVNKSYLEITAWGSAQLNISVPILEETWVPKLSYSEQTAIVNYLDQKTTEIATLIEKEEQRMALLKEYRAALISEVVTGKVKVV